MTIAGPEAHHALRVKRLEVGDRVELLDGRGHVGEGRLAATRKRGQEWEIDVQIVSRTFAELPRPRVHVLAAAPKGDRLAEMIDGLSQVGAASWGPLLSERTVVEPREGKMDRLARVAAEGMKQCGRRWVLEIRPAVSFADAIGAVNVVVADAAGGGGARVEEEVTLIVGPEGGWSAGEMKRMIEGKARMVRFGVNTMRTETAAVVAAGVLMAGGL